eukprot:SAG22_NODE_536_length_9364_cov_15.973988_11_plen_190_part_00
MAGAGSAAAGSGDAGQQQRLYGVCLRTGHETRELVTPAGSRVEYAAPRCYCALTRLPAIDLVVRLLHGLADSDEARRTAHADKTAETATRCVMMITLKRPARSLLSAANLEQTPARRSAPRSYGPVPAFLCCHPGLIQSNRPQRAGLRGGGLAPSGGALGRPALRNRRALRAPARAPDTCRRCRRRPVG